MAVTQQHAPPPNAPIASTSTAAVPSKRHRRPSVRLGEIGDLPAATLTKVRSSSSSRLRNSGTLTLDEIDNLDDDHIAIGNWKTKGSKSKRVRTNCAPKIEANNHNHNHNHNVHGDDDGDGGEFGIEEESRQLSMENRGGELAGLNNVRVCRGDGVRVWLNGLGLGRYWPVFEVHEVDEEVLPLLTLEDLKDMGINAVGSRRKLFSAIQKLTKVFS